MRTREKSGATISCSNTLSAPIHDFAPFLAGISRFDKSGKGRREADHDLHSLQKTVASNAQTGKRREFFVRDDVFGNLARTEKNKTQEEVKF